MKLSELSTDRAADVLCELVPHVSNIVNDPDTISTIGKVVSQKGQKLSGFGVQMLSAGRIVDFLPILLKTHRADVYGILSIMNERPVAEIAAQKLIETIKQVKDLLHDDDFVDFFKSSVQQAQTKQSAPSATSPA